MVQIEMTLEIDDRDATYIINAIRAQMHRDLDIIHNPPHHGESRHYDELAKAHSARSFTQGSNIVARINDALLKE